MHEQEQLSHIHVQTGGVSHDPELYAETVRLIREADEDIVINDIWWRRFHSKLEHPEKVDEDYHHQRTLVTYYQKCVH